VECLIDLTGRALRIGKRNVATAVRPVGFIFIRTIGRTAIITLQPPLVSQLTLAGAAYMIADLNPDRTILIVGIVNPECRIFPRYIDALRKLGELVSGRENGHAATGIKFLV